jgi:hypothetical protein
MREPIGSMLEGLVGVASGALLVGVAALWKRRASASVATPSRR